ncbi:MAG: hypothetical protein ABWZ25_11355 [Chitinophagaceae bacterium]
MEYQKYVVALIIVMIVTLFSCDLNGQKSNVIQEKNKCFNKKMGIRRSEKAYKDVMSRFLDTFEVLKTNKKYFGLQSIVSNRIDESVFFNKEKTECLLLVLQRMDSSSIVFGSVRIVRGKLVAGAWVFKPSMTYTYDRDYFKLYPNNSFEKISMLGRYSVLTDGNAVNGGCEIDEEYWFRLMPT